MNSGEKIAWEALEYEEHPKTPDWFWALGIIALSTVVAAIIYHNFLFAVFIVVAVSLLIIYSVRKPELVLFEINENGVKIGNYLYEYRHLKSFAVVGKSRKAKLLLETDRFFMPLMTIPLGDANWEKVHALLKENIEEKEMDEPASHRVMEYLGF